MSAAILLPIFTVISCTLSKELWKDARQPIEQRVNALLSKMTLDEKIAQLLSWDYYPPATFTNGIYK